MIFNELSACEDHFSFENYTRMPIAAIIWLLENIRPAIERKYIYMRGGKTYVKVLI